MAGAGKSRAARVLFGAGATAIVVAGGAFAAFADPGGSSAPVSSSTTTTTVSSTSKAPPTTPTACKKSYPPATPTLTISASPTSVASGHSATLSGLLSTLGCVLSKESITLHGVAGTHDIAFATVTTTQSGTYSFT